MYRPHSAPPSNAPIGAPRRKGDKASAAIEKRPAAYTLGSTAATSSPPPNASLMTGKLLAQRNVMTTSTPFHRRPSIGTPNSSVCGGCCVGSGANDASSCGSLLLPLVVGGSDDDTRESTSSRGLGMASVRRSGTPEASCRVAFSTLLSMSCLICVRVGVASRLVARAGTPTNALPAADEALVRAMVAP